jgi:hypothetical protein
MDGVAALADRVQAVGMSLFSHRAQGWLYGCMYPASFRLWRSSARRHGQISRVWTRVRKIVGG